MTCLNRALKLSLQNYQNLLGTVLLI